LGPAYAVPPCPPHLRPRPELAQVTAALLRDDGTGTASRITALVGPAGSGTTSLALLACHDARVRHRFGGGVLWLTVGRERAPAEVAALLYGMFREAPGRGPRAAAGCSRPSRWTGRPPTRGRSPGTSPTSCSGTGRCCSSPTTWPRPRSSSRLRCSPGRCGCW